MSSELESYADSESAPYRIEQNLYKGVLVDDLKSGQELPVGGNMFGGPMDTFLELDFDFIEDRVGGFNKDNLAAKYLERKEAFDEWFDELKIKDLDPEVFFVIFNIQKAVTNLLDTKGEAEDSVPLQNRRMELYRKNKSVKLSELVGDTMCAERASLGQYLLQKSGMKSKYMSGIIMDDPKDVNEFPENHSFIILDTNTGQFVYDIARPYNSHDIPRLFKLKDLMDSETLKDTDDYLKQANSVIGDEEIWFGVGDVTAGYHNVE